MAKLPFNIMWWRSEGSTGSVQPLLKVGESKLIVIRTENEPLIRSPSLESEPEEYESMGTYDSEDSIRTELYA